MCENRFDSFKTSPMSTEIRQTLCFRGLVLDLINTRVYVLGTNNGPGANPLRNGSSLSGHLSFFPPSFSPSFYPPDGESLRHGVICHSHHSRRSFLRLIPPLDRFNAPPPNEKKEEEKRGTFVAPLLLSPRVISTRVISDPCLIPTVSNPEDCVCFLRGNETKVFFFSFLFFSFFLFLRLNQAQRLVREFEKKDSRRRFFEILFFFFFFNFTLIDVR